ncbi:hypothetical protein ATO12_08155 [Aquimarina atlantica]|uniref:Signal transduction histidine kinase internal region domain-containing protein n=1 Tax=Aquimarina atlantica TaxID=1317122 RepID=A0A023BMR8_9FLAO|nr:histidine kinase [Aquimarina atlantica]EZH71352.1 hypothetical protein ATO12_08155 [Aquimarina atlantica]
MRKHLKRFWVFYFLVVLLLCIPVFLSEEIEYIIWAISSVLIISIYFFIDIFIQNKREKKLKEEKLVSELQLLKAQINPHFFFNTLNNLYGLTINKSDKAPELVLKLSEMMRYTIYKGREDFVSIEDEINYIKAYISLQKIRLKKKVDIIFTQDIINPKTKIAPLLFIILVENAFKHGVEKTINKGYVKIELLESLEKIQFSVVNNYVQQAIQDGKNKGVGIQNLNKRLQLIYPNQHSISVKRDDKNYKVFLQINKR